MVVVVFSKISKIFSERERERERERGIEKFEQKINRMYKSILERGKSEGRNLNRLTVAFTLGYMAALGKTEAHTTLTKPKVCVTGGSGFVAGHVCKVLIESGRFSEVRATTRTKSLEKTGFLERRGVNVISGCGKSFPNQQQQQQH
jgi:hypothetical protein